MDTLGLFETVLNSYSRIQKVLITFSIPISCNVCAEAWLMKSLARKRSLICVGDGQNMISLPCQQGKLVDEGGKKCCAEHFGVLP